jgi:adenine-specific DNA-methyltransferase
MVFDWLRYNGVVKGNIVEFSEKPIASIPFRKINFSDMRELEIHNKISILTQEYINSKDKDIEKKIILEVNKLFN